MFFLFFLHLVLVFLGIIILEFLQLNSEIMKMTSHKKQELGQILGALSFATGNPLSLLQ